MNRFTKNDLSAGKVKLDYQALLATAKTAFYRTLHAIAEHCESLMRPNASSGSDYLTAEHLADYAEDLAIVTDTLAALRGGLDREELEIVNKPPVEVEK